MGLISGSGSFTRFFVDGSLPQDFMEEFSEKITPYAFRNLDDKSLEERSIGWVNIMNMFDDRFAAMEYLKEPFIAMSWRVDVRKVPKTALKQHCLAAEEEIKEREQMEFLPKRRRSEIKEGIQIQLLKRAIPTSKTYDMVWNLNTGVIIFGCVNNKLCDEFAEFFLKTFGLHLDTIFPYLLASRFLDKEGNTMDLIDNLSPSVFTEVK